MDNLVVLGGAMTDEEIANIAKVSKAMEVRKEISLEDRNAIINHCKDRIAKLFNALYGTDITQKEIDRAEGEDVTTLGLDFSKWSKGRKYWRAQLLIDDFTGLISTYENDLEKDARELPPMCNTQMNHVEELIDSIDSRWKITKWVRSLDLVNVVIIGVVILCMILIIIWLVRENLVTNSPQLISSYNDIAYLPSYADRIKLPFRYF